MPAIGLGTWQLEGRECVEAVRDALALGYRHIDTAEAYQNEEAVGVGIRRSAVDRDEVWITTKVWWEHLDRSDCLRSAHKSLERLGTDYVDLLLIHWPDEDSVIDDALSAMVQLQDEGKVRHIGVSNFTPTLLRRALEEAPVICNQVEYHPFLAQDELVAMAQEEDLILTAYSPVAQGRVTEDETLRRIGEAHGKSAAQVALRWLLQQPKVAAIPRSSSHRHRRANLEIFDFRLDEDEMEEISALDEGLRLIEPEFAPDWER
ncbi:MAG: aldo/keto reductase [Longimicrobiales bacterium]|nr:aldo/keto reductase [Longimicrobiales bacterium]